MVSFRVKGPCKRTQHCWPTTRNIVEPNMLRPFAWNRNNVGTFCHLLRIDKVLGVTLQNNLKWDLHINEIVGKASKRLHILPILKRGGVPPCDLLRVFSLLIRSILEYCCPVWHSSLPVRIHLSDKREKVQKRALRIIYPVLRYPEALLTSGFT